MSVTFDPRFDRGPIRDRPVSIVRLVVLVAVVLVFDALLFVRLRIVGVGPEPFVALAVLGGLELGVSGGAALGLFAGLAADMCTTTPVGLWAFVGGLLGFAFGLVHERAYSDSLRRPPFALVAIGTVFALLLEPSFAFVVSETPFPSPLRLMTILLVTPLWAIVLTFPLRSLLRFVMRSMT